MRLIRLMRDGGDEFKMANVQLDDDEVMVGVAISTRSLDFGAFMLLVAKPVER